MRQIRLLSISLALAASFASAQVIQTLAGGGPNNIPGTAAAFGCPFRAVAGLGGTYYFSDPCAQRVYFVSVTGAVTVVAGDGTSGFSGDGGPATAATLHNPYGVALDSAGNVYIADSNNNRIRRVAAGTGVITTVAGTNGGGYNGDGIPATNAYLNQPYGIAVDSAGNLFIADSGNQRIRMVSASTALISTVAGSGNTCSSLGDGGPATSANLCSPYGVTIDAVDDIYIADSGWGRVRRVAASTGIITTFAGGGSSLGDGGPAANASLGDPVDVSLDTSGDLYIADLGDQRIREVNASSGNISTVAGNGTAGFSGDGGPATSAELNSPYGVGVDHSGGIFIADHSNQRVRYVAAGTGYISTAAGGGSEGDGYQAVNAILGSPSGVATDSSGNVYIADQDDQRVRRVSASTGIITTVAGNGVYGFSGDGGTAANAMLYNPYGVAVDTSGNLYIADQANQRIRKVTASSGLITTVAGNGSASYAGDGGPATNASLNNPGDVAVDSAGNLYIADASNNRIRLVVASTGIIITVAGNGAPGYAGDGGAATNANLNNPQGVALDNLGNLLIADSYNQRIRRVNLSSGVITTVAGNGIPGFNSDGQPATTASLYYPSGVTSDSTGNIYIADASNARIRRIDATTGEITTVAGNGDYFFSGDGGPAVSANLANPTNLTISSSGNLYIADESNNRIRMVTFGSALALSPSTVTFANQTSGVTSSPQSVTLSNNGLTSILLSGISVSGTFAVAGTTCGASLGAGASCTIMVTFTPLAAVSESGFLTVTAYGVLYSATLQGQGTLAGGAGTITDVIAGSGLNGGGTTGSVTLSVDSTVARTNSANTFSGNQTINGTVTATAFSGNGSTLTNLNPAALSAGTAAINITGNAATATSASHAYLAQTAGELNGIPAANYARLNTANAFTGNQGITGNVAITGNLSTTGAVTIGGGTPIKRYLSMTFEITLPALAVGSCATLNEPVTAVGSDTNDTISLGVSNAFMSGTSGLLVFQAWESAMNTISIRVCNVSGATTSSITNSIRVDLFKH